MDPQTLLSTNTDALLSRKSAIDLGYYVDPYTNLLLTPQQRRRADRRPALINIGTYLRTYAINRELGAFIKSHDNACVVSLGAGSDSRFWIYDNVSYWVEVDFPELAASKARLIKTNKPLAEKLGEVNPTPPSKVALASEKYALIGDAIEAHNLDSLFARIRALLPENASVFFLAECFFAYMEPALVDAVLRKSVALAPSGQIVSYDPFSLSDNFGRVMLDHLAARGLALPSAKAMTSLDALNARLSAVCASATSSTLKDVRLHGLPPGDLERLMRIETPDEWEEIDLVLEHYAVSTGVW